MGDFNYEIQRYFNLQKTIDQEQNQKNYNRIDKNKDIKWRQRYEG